MRAVTHATVEKVGNVSYPSTLLRFYVQKYTCFKGCEAHKLPRSRNSVFPLRILRTAGFDLQDVITTPQRHIDTMKILYEYLKNVRWVVKGYFYLFFACVYKAKAL
jgi:hypothetical protein